MIDEHHDLTGFGDAYIRLSEHFAAIFLLQSPKSLNPIVPRIISTKEHTRPGLALSPKKMIR